MELSIIVTTYKNPELLKVCLNSIQKNCSLSDIEIIVAESSAQEETELLMREDFPGIKYIPFKKNIGLARLLERAYESCCENTS